MEIPIHIAEKLWQLLQGESIPASVAKHEVIKNLILEEFIIPTGRIQKKLSVSNRNELNVYLQNKYGISDLQRYIQVNKQEIVTRRELVSVSSDSKLVNVRTFKGFLVNSYSPIQATLKGQPIVLNPIGGTFRFIYDYESFLPQQEVTIIGIENSENFRYVEKLEYLFKDIQPLFVSRYPQNQSKDLIKWLKAIPNLYLHFGDFDFAGIGIYLNEFKKHLAEKATFFIPENIERLIIENGNRKRYELQNVNFAIQTIKEEKLLSLINIIHKHKKSLDQEILIMNNDDSSL